MAYQIPQCDGTYGKEPDCPYCQHDLYGQCTDFVYHAAKSENVNLPAAMGNAGDWVTYAHGQSWTVSMTPAAGTVLCYSGQLPGSDGDGHVCLVQSVNGQQIQVQEANWQYPANQSPGKTDCRSDGPGSSNDFSKYWLGFITVAGLTPSGSGNTSGNGGALDLSGISTAIQTAGLDLEAAAQTAENQAISAAQIAAGGLMVGAGGWLLMSGTRAPYWARDRVRQASRQVRQPARRGLPTHLTAEERQWLSPMTQGQLAELHPDRREQRANRQLLAAGRGQGNVTAEEARSRLIEQNRARMRARHPGKPEEPPF